MEQRLKVAVFGWIRQNYDDEFLDDITEIIYQFYLIIIDSNILKPDEETSLYNLLLDHKKQHKVNDYLNSIQFSLLFRGSEHGFSSDKFHEICDGKGPTVSIIHNNHGHVFGGYASKSWKQQDFGYVSDTNTFLWVIRPNVKKFALRQGREKNAIYSAKGFGPSFGITDIWISDGATNNGCSSRCFLFDEKELAGAKTPHGATRFSVIEYEVFAISFE